MASSTDVLLGKDPIPQAIMSQVLTCHNAHTEFLRQFWSAVLPTPPGTLGAPTPEQKMTKARKMAKFLSLMKEKVDSVVQSAAQDPTVDTERVREVSVGGGAAPGTSNAYVRFIGTGSDPASCRESVGAVCYDDSI